MVFLGLLILLKRSITINKSLSWECLEYDGCNRKIFCTHSRSLIKFSNLLKSLAKVEKLIVQ